MPRGVVAVHRIQLLSLRVALVTFVVASAVAQVDAADEGDVVSGMIRVQGHHELLVMGTPAARARRDAVAPAAATVRTSSRSSSSLNPHTSDGAPEQAPDPHATPRRAHVTDRPASDQSGLRSSSWSPLQSVRKTWSPARRSDAPGAAGRSRSTRGSTARHRCRRSMPCLVPDRGRSSWKIAALLRVRNQVATSSSDDPTRLASVSSFRHPRAEGDGPAALGDPPGRPAREAARRSDPRPAARPRRNRVEVHERVTGGKGHEAVGPPAEHISA